MTADHAPYAGQPISLPCDPVTDNSTTTTWKSKAATLQQFQGRIGRSVVHVQDFPFIRYVLQGAGNRLMKPYDEFFLVIDGTTLRSCDTPDWGLVEMLARLIATLFLMQKLHSLLLEALELSTGFRQES